MMQTELRTPRPAGIRGRGVLIRGAPVRTPRPASARCRGAPVRWRTPRPAGICCRGSPLLRLLALASCLAYQCAGAHLDPRVSCRGAPGRGAPVVEVRPIRAPALGAIWRYDRRLPIRLPALASRRTVSMPCRSASACLSPAWRLPCARSVEVRPCAGNCAGACRAPATIGTTRTRPARGGHCGRPAQGRGL